METILFNELTRDLPPRPISLGQVSDHTARNHVTMITHSINSVLFLILHLRYTMSDSPNWGQCINLNNCDICVCLHQH